MSRDRSQVGASFAAVPSTPNLKSSGLDYWLPLSLLGYELWLFFRIASVQPATSMRNPYGNLTEPQFDKWIEGITGTLRKTLGIAVPRKVAKAPRCKIT